jgi:hypothetical protein
MQVVVQVDVRVLQREDVQVLQRGLRVLLVADALEELSQQAALVWLVVVGLRVGQVGGIWRLVAVGEPAGASKGAAGDEGTVDVM